jgi:excinuclease UvrABC ATPase subunit
MRPAAVFSTLTQPEPHKAGLAPAELTEITGIGPAISVSQNILNRNPSSTLATATGIQPFLRLLFARFGSRSCSFCGAKFHFLNEGQVLDLILSKYLFHLILMDAIGLFLHLKA